MFKKSFMYYFFVSAIIAGVMQGSLFAMELSPEEQAKRKITEGVITTPESDPVKRVKLSDIKTLKSLPLDVLVKILTSVDTPAQAIKNIKSLMRADKHFYTVMSNDAGNKALIKALARRFFHYDQFQAAKVLNTAASRSWINTAINSEIQKQLQAVLTANARAIAYQDLSSIRNFLNAAYAGTEQTIGDTFFSSAAARIWLIKKILAYTTNKILMLERIKDLLFPKITADPELDDWITSVQKNLTSKIGELVREGKSKELQKLIAEGVDVSQNFITGASYTFHAKDAPTLKLLIAAGADINAIQPQTGNTALHIILSEINDESIVQGTSLSNSENQDVTLKVRTLLEAGANPTIKNVYKQTPLDIVKVKTKMAQRYRRGEDPFLLSLERLFKKYGATQ